MFLCKLWICKALSDYLLVHKPAPYSTPKHGGQGERKRGRPSGWAGGGFNMQGTYTWGLSCKTTWSLHPYGCPDGLNMTLLSQVCILETGSHLGNGWRMSIPRTGEGWGASHHSGPPGRWTSCHDLLVTSPPTRHPFETGSYNLTWPHFCSVPWAGLQGVFWAWRWLQVAIWLRCRQRPLQQYRYRQEKTQFKMILKTITICFHQEPWDSNHWFMESSRLGSDHAGLSSCPPVIG